MYVIIVRDVVVANKIKEIDENNIYKNLEPLLFDECEGEFGDDEGSEDGYENCLWNSGDEEEDEED